MTAANHLHDQHNPSNGPSTILDDDEVARTAFGIYERLGSQHGRDLQNWLEAESRVKAMRATTVLIAPAAPTKTKQPAH